jgi:RIO kinase 1
MSFPDSLMGLIDLGIIDEIIRPLQAGKEAQIYLVIARGELRVAKVYKEANQRSFKHRSTYTEGRRVQSSRKQRAMDKASSYGRKEIEAAWRNAEVDCLYRLFEAGVRVPSPYDFVDGVLVMELIQDGNGEPAPRLVDLSFRPKEAEKLLERLIQEVVRMLCAGVIHADLSDFNILFDAHGPVVIDFPQAVDPAQNQQAKQLLLRDVKNLTNFLGRFAPHLRKRQYGKEMWALYERNQLTPETRLTGKFKRSDRNADTHSLIAQIQDEAREYAERQETLGGMSKYAARRAKRINEEAEAAAAEQARIEKAKAKAARRAAQGSPDSTRPADGEGKRRSRRRRRRRRGGKPKSGPPKGSRQ